MNFEDYVQTHPRVLIGANVIMNVCHPYNWYFTIAMFLFDVVRSPFCSRLSP